MIVAVCYKTPLGPQISFYEASSEEQANRYLVEQEARDDFISSGILPKG